MNSLPDSGPADGAFFKLLQRLGLNSMRGRYLWGSAVFLILLMAAALYGQSVVRQVSYQSDSNSLQRQAARYQLQEITNQIWITQISLQGYMLTPEPRHRDQVLISLDRILVEVPLLADSPWIMRDNANQQIARKLLNDLVRLRAEVERIMQIRVTPSLLYPAIPLMLDVMLPATIEFDTAATLAIEDAKLLIHQSGQNEIYRNFSEARRAWQQLAGAFRNLVANRFGIFGDPETGIRGQAHNIRLYMETIEASLQKLVHLQEKHTFELQEEESLNKMLQLLPQWRHAYKKVYAILTSDNWRTDVPLLRDGINPLFSDTWNNIRLLDKELDAFSKEDISTLTHAADRLSNAIWLLMLLATFVVMFGYFVYHYSILRPTARVSAALKAEARGITGPVIKSGSTRETSDLIDAFDLMRRQVHSRQQRLEAVFDHAAEGIITVDQNGSIESFNAAAERLFRRRAEEVLGVNIAQLIPELDEVGTRLANLAKRSEQDAASGEAEHTALRKDHSVIDVSIKVSTIQLPDKLLYCIIIADISERKAMLSHLTHLAQNDTLTGLSNRGFFQSELERVLHDVRRHPDQHCALLYIDLDNFKYVNDTLGHSAGDQLLIEVAELLQARTRKSDLLARFGGDEFTVLVYDAHTDSIMQIAEEFRQLLADYSFRHDGRQVDIGCSIGVSVIDNNSQSTRDLLAQADLACHLAKRGGRNRVHLFNPDNETDMSAMSREIGWSRRIKQALEHNQFQLACQPVIRAGQNDVAFFEILLRLPGESGELIAPSAFIPAAERFGLGGDIDRWVIEQALQLMVLQRDRNPDLVFSINLCASTLNDTSLCDYVEGRLAHHGIPATSLVFEIPEHVATDQLAGLQALLERLRKTGCRTALDDFGCGMSSFSYLQDLPIDMIKIDGRYIRDIVENPVHQAMLRAFNDVAHTMNIKTLAENVESEAVQQCVTRLGVDYIQGFHLGKPDVSLPCATVSRICDTAIN